AHAPAPAATLVVPDLCRQPFVFAKSLIEDGGFAWRVATAGRGYSSDVVVGQRPAPGTRVVDTGDPRIELELAKNPDYAQRGAPYPGSPLRAARGAKLAAAKCPAV